MQYVVKYNVIFLLVTRVNDKRVGCVTWSGVVRGSWALRGRGALINAPYVYTFSITNVY